jgi:hypothetical protein
MKRAAFTLVEMLIAAAMTAILGGIVYAILNTGLVLFAKNTAINMAHQQARVAVIQMESDLHASVSLPQLVDTNRAPISGVGPAAGISFQLFAAGPFKITAPAAAGSTQIQLALGTYQPKAGQRLVIPTHQIEIDLAADCPGSGNRSVSLISGTGNAVALNIEDGHGAMMSVDVIGFITDRITYVVQSGELRYYGRRTSAAYSVMATDITSTTPFSTPTTPAGAPFYRFVSAINLSTADPTATARGFKAANMFLNAQVPCRTRLCAYQ